MSLVLVGELIAVRMNEEIPSPIAIAIVEGYDGTVKPTIGAFANGNNYDLGLDFTLNADNEWEMIVTNKQDYEQVSMQKYTLRIIIDNKEIVVQITIVNIFDNAPIVTRDSNPCTVPVISKHPQFSKLHYLRRSLLFLKCLQELTDPTYESQCTYVS